MRPTEIACLLSEDIRFNNGLLLEVCLSESKDSDIIVDLDETLIHQLHINQGLIDLLTKQETNLSKTPAAPQSINQNDLINAIQQYNYKNNLFLTQQANGEPILVVIRPGACELLKELETLQNAGKIKSVSIYTGNKGNVGQNFINNINQRCGTTVPLFNKNTHSFDSALVDDDEGSARLKLIKIGLAPMTNLRAPLHQWLEVPKFNGDLSDTYLKNFVMRIKAKVRRIGQQHRKGQI